MTQLLLLFDYHRHPLIGEHVIYIEQLTYEAFVNVYALGTMLSLFYYAGVLGDANERKNLQKWHRVGVPLARYLHTTHSTSFLMVNVDAVFRDSNLVCKHLPEVQSSVMGAAMFAGIYSVWVLLNYSRTGFFPYPFMNEMKDTKVGRKVGGWAIPAVFLILMAFLGMTLTYAAFHLTIQTKCIQKWEPMNGLEKWLLGGWTGLEL
jgi:hypothetical protein